MKIQSNIFLSVFFFFFFLDFELERWKTLRGIKVNSQP
jgi:hypothetical protein